VDAAQLMAAVLARLSSDDLLTAAAYLASLKPYVARIACSAIRGNRHARASMSLKNKKWLARTSLAMTRTIISAIGGNSAGRALLTLLGRHKVPVGAQHVVLLADAHVRIGFVGQSISDNF
jgi:hypothetical protein